MSRSANQTRQRRRRALAYAVVALLGLSAVGFAAWSSLGQTATAGTRSTAPASSGPAASGPAASGPAAHAAAAIGVAPVSTGPVALKPADPPRVAAWSAGPGGATLTAVTGHLGTVLMAHDARQYVQMKRECISLAAEVKTAGAQPVIPDPAMQNLYRKALASLTAGAANCVAAVSSHQEGDEDLITTTNSSLLATAMSQLDTGTRDLYIATGKIKGLKRG